MAKTKTINESCDIQIIPSQDVTYKINNNIADTAEIKFLADSDTIYYTPKKNSDDLYIIAIFGEFEEGNAQSSIITVKDYFKYIKSNNNLIKIKNNEIYSEVCELKDAGFVMAQGKVEGSLLSYIGDRKKTTYIVNQVIKADPNDDEAELFDLGGNDKYDLSSEYAKDLSIADLKGNDKYSLKNGANVNIYDMRGKDKYTVDKSSLVLTECTGNDKYTFIEPVVQMYDLTGKDNYTISGAGSIGDITAEIHDFSGNDKYTVSNSDKVYLYDGLSDSDIVSEPSLADLADKGGKDKYTVSNTSNITITDKKDNDTYKFTNVINVDEEDDLVYNINDIEGNDKYTFSGTNTRMGVKDKNGKDTYNIKGSYNKKLKQADYVQEVNIIDEGLGKNTFNINYAKYAYINSKNSNNVANIKNSYDVKITTADINIDKVNKDTYNLTSNNFFEISDYSYNDTGDTYNIKKSPTGKIWDEKGNETYKIDSLKFNYYSGDYDIAGIHIYDRAGDNDTLSIKSLNQKNLVYMTDFTKSEGKNKSYNNSLIIYDKSTQGYVYIDEFFDYDVESYDFIGFDNNGRIETIKAGKKKLDIGENESYYKNFNKIKSDVISWMEGKKGTGGNEFNYLEDVLMFGTNEQKAELVTYFDGSHYNV